MRAPQKYWWDQLDFIRGAEEEGDGGEGGTGSAPEEGQGNDPGDNDGRTPPGNQGEDDEADKGLGEDTRGLKSALEKERADRKALEKELKAFRKAEQERRDAEKSEVDRLTDQANRNAEKLTKLSQRYRQSAVEAAIRKAAGQFINPEDAVEALRGSSTIEVEQDDDDPTEISIDSRSVERAVKDLGRSKPHWLKTPPPSGSKFGGKGGGQGDNTQELMARYPALRARFGG